MSITDAAAEDLLQQMLTLAVAVRDEGPDAVTAILDGITDQRAALVVAAALIRVDQPVDRWWQQGMPDGGLTVTGHCTRCADPIHDRLPTVRYCEPCRVDVRRESWRNTKAASRNGQVAA